MEYLCMYNCALVFRYIYRPQGNLFVVYPYDALVNQPSNYFFFYRGKKHLEKALPDHHRGRVRDVLEKVWLQKIFPKSWKEVWRLEAERVRWGSSNPRRKSCSWILWRRALSGKKHWLKCLEKLKVIIL